MSEPTPAAASVRGTLIKALLASWAVAPDPASQAMARITAARDVDTILAALAVDHGDLRDHMADAILAATYPPDEWPDGPPGEGEMDTAREQADAALAAIEQHPVLEIRPYYPTQDAYDAACRALEKHRKRADEAERLLEERTAELGQALRRAEHAEGELSSRRDHETRWELERQKREEAEAAIERVRAIPRLPFKSEQEGVQGRAYTRGWQSVIDAINAALGGGQ